MFPSADPRRRLQNRSQDILTNRLSEVFQDKWQPIVELFAAGQNKRKLYGIVADVMGSAGSSRRDRSSSSTSRRRGNQGRFWSDELQEAWRFLGSY